jgi:hypothetical protein
MISEKALIRSLIGKRRFVHGSRLRRSFAGGDSQGVYVQVLLGEKTYISQRFVVTEFIA